jgi:hypothetical protein
MLAPRGAARIGRLEEASLRFWISDFDFRGGFCLPFFHPGEDRDDWLHSFSNFDLFAFPIAAFQKVRST